MTFRLACCALLTATLIGGTALADWREVRTENFRIVTDSRAQKAEATARQMELYRSALLRFFDLPDVPEPKPIDVALYERLRMFSSDFDGIGNAIGIYSASIHGPAFAAYVDKERDGAVPAGLTIIKHEFVHHLVYSQSKIQYPRWYAEGYAEFLRTMRVEDGRAVLGEVPIERLHALNRLNWYGPELYEGTARWGVKGGGPLYGQAWLTVHYLLTSDALRGQVPLMLSAIDGGLPPAEAMKTHLGMTPDALLAAVKAYWRSGELAVLYMSVDEREEDIEVRTQKVSSKAAFGMRQKIVGRFRMGDAKRADNWRKEHVSDLKRYLRAHPDDVEARYWIASHHAMNRDLDALGEALTALSDVAPGHAYTHFMRGALHRLEAARAAPDDPVAARAATLAARAAFASSRDADPEFGRAHYAYARTWLTLGDEVTPEAVSAIKQADDLVGEAEELPFTYGALLIRAGQVPQGERMLRSLRLFKDDKALSKRIDEELARASDG